ncbi:uncharacterized protein WM277_017323 isoform 1-T1 [Molossus nigricans]
MNCIKSGKKPTQRTSLIIDAELPSTALLLCPPEGTWGSWLQHIIWDENIGSEDSSLSDALVLEDGTAAKSTAPGHDKHQILHTGRGLLIQGVPEHISVEVPRTNFKGN